MCRAVPPCPGGRACGSGPGPGSISEALLSLGLDKNGVIVELRVLLPAPQLPSSAAQQLSHFTHKSSAGKREAETDFVTRNQLFQQCAPWKLQSVVSCLWHPCLRSLCCRTLRHLAKMLVAEPETAGAGVEAMLVPFVACKLSCSVSPGCAGHESCRWSGETFVHAQDRIRPGMLSI